MCVCVCVLRFMGTENVNINLINFECVVGKIRCLLGLISFSDYLKPNN